jgi:hypothetical protein
LEHLDDIESDLSAHHRVDDVYSMESRKYFKFAARLHGYRGIMRFRYEQLAAEEQEKGKSPTPPTPKQQQQPNRPPTSKETGPKTGAAKNKPGEKVYFDDLTKNPDLFSPGIDQRGRPMPSLFAPPGQDDGPRRKPKKPQPTDE